MENQNVGLTLDGTIMSHSGSDNGDVGFAVQHLEIHAKGSLIEIMTELLGSTVWRIE